MHLRLLVQGLYVVQHVLCLASCHAFFLTVSTPLYTLPVP